MESLRRHWSSRQVTPVAKSALFQRTPLIPTPAFHHDPPPPLSSSPPPQPPLLPPPPPSPPPPASPLSFIHHHLLRLPPPSRGTRHVTDSPSPLTNDGPAYLPPVAPLPLRRGLSRQVHQPKCHSAYLCVCAYQGRVVCPVVRFFPLFLSLLFFFPLSLSLSLSLFPFFSSFPRSLSLPPSFSPYLSPYLCVSVSLSVSLFFPLLFLSIRLSSSTSPHAAVPCCSVVSSRGTSTILSDWRQGSTGSRVHSAITGAGRSPVYSRVKKVNPSHREGEGSDIPNGTRVL